MKRKSTASLVLEALDEHLLMTNVSLSHHINRTPADVSSTTNRLVKRGELVRLHTDYNITWLYALRSNRHVARLSVRLLNHEHNTHRSDF